MTSRNENSVDDTPCDIRVPLLTLDYQYLFQMDSMLRRKYTRLHPGVIARRFRRYCRPTPALLPAWKRSPTWKGLSTQPHESGEVTIGGY